MPGGFMAGMPMIESFRCGRRPRAHARYVRPIATRGGRLVLTRARYSRSDEQPEALTSISYSIVEIDTDERIAAVVMFDLDDFDAAIAELEARYVAGEAAAHARTWSVIMQGYASLNRRELPSTTPDWVNIDHRRGATFAPGDNPALLSAARNVTSDRATSSRRCIGWSDLGAVVTHVANGTSREGFHAEWRVISVLTVDGDLVSRCEVFDEADFDAAIARFDQLSRPAPRLENAASQVTERFAVH